MPVGAGFDYGFRCELGIRRSPRPRLNVAAPSSGKSPLIASRGMAGDLLR